MGDKLLPGPSLKLQTMKGLLLDHLLVCNLCNAVALFLAIYMEKTALKA